MESIKKIKRRSVNLIRNARVLLVFSLMTAIYTGMASQCQAQTFSEWFRQGSTQKKYLLQQIAALEVYSTYLKQGYKIAHNGLGSVSGHLNLENALHGTYYLRMDNASDAVRNNSQVGDILNWQKDILTTLSAISGIVGLSSEEMRYLSDVRSAVLKDCDFQMNTLQNVISNGKTKMSDAERLAIISKIHGGMLDNSRFAAGFTNQAKILARQRIQEQQDARTGRMIYAIN